MSKRKAQFYNDMDLEIEQPQYNFNLLNNHSSIQDKKIRKGKLHVNSKINNQISSNPSLKCQLETKANQHNKTSQLNRKQILTSKKEKYNNLEQLPHFLSVLKKSFNKPDFDNRQQSIELKNNLQKQIFLPLFSIKEIEEYILYQSKLKSVKINDSLYLKENLELIVFKFEKQHKIKIEPGLIEGLILNDKILKNQNQIYLECYSNQKIYQIQIEFEDKLDYEQFQLF
ncbi:unnamed protein product [Paramecium sonneborni]|uniref:Uncharacterized protein n=1 Tax=Paramecium sonneborni TaxID=65129 RepID=A0A8S1KPC3_9CILI|nr:unnamed protein product [Paramecium sonneborni]